MDTHVPAEISKSRNNKQLHIRTGWACIFHSAAPVVMGKRDRDGLAPGRSRSRPDSQQGTMLRGVS